jgi:lipopolysaccharide export system protein LptA
MKVDAQEYVSINMNTHDIRARDRVRSRMMQAKNATDTHTPALFDANQPVLASATEMVYLNQTKSARFAGSATSQAMVYQQEDNFIRGDRVEVQQDTGNLTATGGVTSSFMLDMPDDKPAGSKPASPRPAAGKPAASAAGKPGPAPAAASKPTPSRGEGDTLEYRDAERTATYIGSGDKLATLRTTGLIEAVRIVITLADESRSVQKLDAAGSVYVSFDDGREAVATTLAYDAALDKYTLTGAPGAAVFFKNIEDKEGKRSCNYEKTTEFLWFVKTQSMTIPPGRSLKPTTSIPCEAKLKAIVKTDK